MLSEILLDDLMELILCQLPAKSLLRFKAVSKPWYQLIESSEFITKHYQTRAAISNNGCLFIQERRPNSFYLVYNHLPTGNRLQDLNRKDGSSINFFHSNGIICLVFDDKVELWNPSIRQSTTLSRSHLIPPPGFLAHALILGISFDPKSNKYKVLNVWTCEGSKFSDCVQKVEVWTQGKDTWKEIDIKFEVWTPAGGKGTWRQDPVPYIPLPQLLTSIDLKGKLYWLGKLHTGVILSFDIVREVFRVAPLPAAQCFRLEEGYFIDGNLAILNESIVAISKPLEHNKQCYEIWLMSEESDQVCWSKYMTIELPTPQRSPVTRSMKNVKRKKHAKAKMFPLGFWKNEELILGDKHGRLVFFNMSTGDIVYSGFEIDLWHKAFHVYNESLVSINEW